MATEAHAIHGVFEGAFYAIIGTLLVIGIVVEYFRLPIGQVPSFLQLLGRAIVAFVLLMSYGDITDAIGTVSDAFAQEIGDFAAIDRVLKRMGERLEDMSATWISVKDSIILAISFLSFFLLYFSKFVAEGLFMFAWVLCYVFSPALIALYVLPSTAAATTALFRTLFEVSMWKVVWAVLSTLVWSSALSTLNSTDANFVAVISFNLALAGSLLLTPWIVHALMNSGIAGYSRTIGGITIGATMITPKKVVGMASKVSGVAANRFRAYQQKRQI